MITIKFNLPMKTIISLLIIIIVLSFYSCSESKKKDKESGIKIIFDTDMGPDYDDVGAITLLHALAAKGECEILATMASDGHATIAPTIDFFNQHFKRSDLPVGIASVRAPDFTASNHWNDSLLSKFSFGKSDKDYPSAVSLYRQVISQQEDNSVTIVTVGFLSNIMDLLNSAPDEFSELNGIDLISKKVKNLVSMAGAFPEGSEFNVNQHPEASYEVFTKWPKPILFSGVEIGFKIFTGAKVADNKSLDDPVAWAYQYNFKTYSKEGEVNRPSWDQTAVLCAIRNPEKYFYVNGPGKFIINKDGSNTWDPDTDSSHYFLTHKYPYEYIADIIDDLMLFQP